MISIEVQDRDVLSVLQQLQHRVSDLSPVMDTIGYTLETIIKQRFESQSDPDGLPWENWAEATQKAYPDNANGRILDRYGDMLGGLSYQADMDSVLVGFDQPYAAYHEFGTKRMPRRGLLFADPEAGALGQDDQREILEILQDHLSI